MIHMALLGCLIWEDHLWSWGGGFGGPSLGKIFEGHSLVKKKKQKKPDIPSPKEKVSTLSLLRGKIDSLIILKEKTDASTGNVLGIRLSNEKKSKGTSMVEKYITEGGSWGGGVHLEKSTPPPTVHQMDFLFVV